MKQLLKFSFFILIFVSTFFSCKKNDNPPSIPSVTTITPTDVTPSFATVGGNITSDGRSLILAAGICYSTSNSIPTVIDDTAKTAVLSGAFTLQINNLASGSTYYVRAYATNSVGTGYGEVKTFTTGNEAPTATNINIDGEIKGNVEVTATYEYQDKENDTESGTIIQWYRADNAAGANTTAIGGATSTKYRISDDDQGKYIWATVTPKAATGTINGVEAKSEKKGPVGEATTVTFMYNGNEVTYGIISSTKTGRRWLDRNLGAPNTPVAFDDFANYGDMFQWGRLADGHQLLVRLGASSDQTSSVNGTTNVQATTDEPGHNKFITGFDNWRSMPNNNLWQGINGVNNPCPQSWRVPNIEEWVAEEFGTDPVSNFTKLNITRTGIRYADASFSAVGSRSYYWSSSIPGTVPQALYFSDGSDAVLRYQEAGNAMAVRCIKDEAN